MADPMPNGEEPVNGSSSLHNCVKRGLKILLTVEGAVASIAFALVAGCLLFDVLGRELFNKGLFGAGQYAVLATVVAGFLGMALATATGSHLKAEVATLWTPTKWEPFANRAGDVLSALVWFGMGVIAIGYVAGSIEADERVAVLYIPIWPLQMVLPYAFFSAALRHAAFAVYPDLRPETQIEAGH